MCCLAILLWGCQPSLPSSVVSARVSQVMSGQTIEIIDPVKQTAEQVRLLGIELPAWKQEPWYGRAKERLQELLSGDRVVILESDLESTITSPDGAVLKLAYLWKNGVLLNEQLVKDGVVLAAARSPNLKYEQRLAHAQEQARLSGVGIWNAARPMRQTPQEFRSAHPQS